MSYLFKNYKTASQFLRQRLGVAKLTSEQVKQVKEAVERHNARQPSPWISADPLVARSRDRRRQVYDAIALEVRELFLERYRHSTSQWAGGENQVTIRITDAPGASGESRKAWSSNGKWRGTNGVFHINIQPFWRQEVLPVPGLVMAGGMLTTHAREIRSGVWQATWIVQRRGFEIEAASGVIVQEGERFFHGKDEADARSVLERQAKQEALEARAGRLSSELRLMSVQDLKDRYGHITITRADSIRCGNCESGTDSWINQHFDGKKSASIREVLTADPSLRVVAACRAAILRQLKKQQKETVTA